MKIVANIPTLICYIVQSLHKLEKWFAGFQKLRDDKVEGYYYGSGIGVPPFSIGAIYEGQAQFSQLQYLYCYSLGQYTFEDFAKAGMLNGIYVEAFNHFLKVLNELCPQGAN